MALDKYIPGSMQGVTPNPLVIDITYAELVDKISLSALIPGQKYRITDYRTAYNMPNVTPAEKIVCEVEPLLVTANSVNTLSMYAYSEAFPQDEIYYDIANNQTMVPGCDMGYIYRRVDKLKNNDICFDYRHVKFRRWKINVTAIWEAGTTYAKDAVVFDVASNSIVISLADGNVGNAVSGGTDNYWGKIPVANASYISWKPSSLTIADAGVLPVTSDYLDFYLFSTTLGVNSIYNTAPNSVTIKGNNTALIVNNNTVLVDNVNNCYWENIAKNNTIFVSASYYTFRYNKFYSGFEENIIYGYGENNIITEMKYNCLSAFNSNNLAIFTYNIQNNTMTNVMHSVDRCIIKNFMNNKGGLVEKCRGTTFKNCYIESTISSSGTILIKGIFEYNTIINLWCDSIGTNCKYNIIGRYSSNIPDNTEYRTFSDYSPKEYTALLSETGYAATSGLLIAGQTYYIASYVAGDDFTNVGGTNVTGNTFVASGTTPTAWTNSSILVSVGISAPAVTLLTNGLSGAIVWTYSAVGTYIGTLSGAFTENKTVFSYPPLGDDKAVTVEWTSANVITVKTYETGALKDGLLVKFPLTIKVYP